MIQPNSHVHRQGPVNHSRSATTVNALSAGRGNDGLLVQILPFARLVQDRGRVDDLKRALVQGRRDGSAHGDELATGQDLLALLADQEVEKEDRRIRMWCVAREPFGGGRS